MVGGHSPLGNDADALSGQMYKKALNEISLGAPQARDMYAKTVTPGGVSYFGAEVFWYGDRAPRFRTLDAAYYFASDSSGLALHAREKCGIPVSQPRPTAISRGNLTRNGSTEEPLNARLGMATGR
jgi:hypothetical protein